MTEDQGYRIFCQEVWRVTSTTVIYAAMKSYFARTFICTAVYLKMARCSPQDTAVVPPAAPVHMRVLSHGLSERRFPLRETNDRTLFRS